LGGLTTLIGSLSLQPLLWIKYMDMFGKMNELEIESLLHREVVGRIGCHAGGITYVVPISFVYDSDIIYAHTYEGMKTEMMRENPEVCFQVDDMHDLSNWQSVIAWGYYDEVSDKHERNAILEKLSKRALPVVSSETMKLGAEWPFVNIGEEKIKGIVFRIVLKTKTGRFEKANAGIYFAT
jgi:uncharacterized protein